jgi:hypothetical protein
VTATEYICCCRCVRWVLDSWLTGEFDGLEMIVDGVIMLFGAHLVEPG